MFSFLNPFDVVFSERYFTPFIPSPAGLNFNIGDSVSLSCFAKFGKFFGGISFKRPSNVFFDTLIDLSKLYLGKISGERFLGFSFEIGLSEQKNTFSGEIFGLDRHAYVAPSIYHSFISKGDLFNFSFSLPFYNHKFFTVTDTLNKNSGFSYNINFLSIHRFSTQWFIVSEFSLSKINLKKTFKTIQQFANFDSVLNFSNFYSQAVLFYNPFGNTFISNGLKIYSAPDSSCFKYVVEGLYEVSRFFDVMGTFTYSFASYERVLSSLEVHNLHTKFGDASLGLRFKKDFMSLAFWISPESLKFESFSLQVKFVK
ncbi:MAG: hypothetical protein ACPLN0_07870 [Candidatus Hydrothermia bacterium]